MHGWPHNKSKLALASLCVQELSETRNNLSSTQTASVNTQIFVQCGSQRPVTERYATAVSLLPGAHRSVAPKMRRTQAPIRLATGQIAD